MNDVYLSCPSFENGRYLLRLISDGDCTDLLKVYSDEKSVPFFNGDNCHGDDFHYTTAQRMRQAVDFWTYSYANRYFVRWTVVDKLTGEAVGTIELFHRDSADAFTDCGLLRLDLRSDHETATAIGSILSLIIQPAFELFYCSQVATKAIPEATERRRALLNAGFEPSVEKLIGDDGTEYDHYWTCTRKTS